MSLVKRTEVIYIRGTRGERCRNGVGVRMEGICAKEAICPKEVAGEVGGFMERAKKKKKQPKSHKTCVYVWHPF